MFTTAKIPYLLPITMTISTDAPVAPATSTRERTISAVFATQTQVQDLIKRLTERGIPAEDISYMGRNFESNTRVTGFITKRDVILGGLKQGAIFGSLFGSFLSLLTGVGVLFIPFVGPVVAAGPIGAALIGAATGALAGSAGAGLASLLATLGMPEDKAAIYETLVSAGEFLVMVEVPEARSGEYQLLLESAGGKEVHTSERVLPRPCPGKCNSPDDLTPEVKSHLSAAAQNMFIDRYNQAIDSGKDPSDATHIAWDAIRENFTEDNDGVWSQPKA
jgi:cation transport regulator ChaB